MKTGKTVPIDIANMENDELARVAAVYRSVGEYVCEAAFPYARRLLALMKCKLLILSLGDTGQPVMTYALSATRRLIIDVWANGRLTWAITGSRVLRRGTVKMLLQGNLPEEVGANCGCG